MTDLPPGHGQQPQQPVPPATPVREAAHDRLIRGLKTAGVGLLVAVAGLAIVVYMGSQQLTGSAAFGALACVLLGAFFLLKGIVLAIWGAVARSRD